MVPSGGGRGFFLGRTPAIAIATAIICLAVPLAANSVCYAADAAALAGQVQIRRTEFGVPHIEAPTLEAVAFGFGYCQAEDHLENILRGILGAGRTGRDLWPRRQGQERYRRLSRRQFRIYTRAVENYHRLDADYRAMLEGFAAGLNYYVARHRGADAKGTPAPEWAFEVTPHDVAAYGVAGVMRFAFDRNNIVRDFLKKQKSAEAQQAAAAYDAPAEREVGSNMWALAPSRSKSGRAMLLGNPHQPWAPVSTYYEAHLTVPGRLNFYGSTFIGRPILTSGWNEHLGWSHTVNGPDLEEIYELSLDPARADHYLFDGGSIPLLRDDVTLKIKGDQPASESRTFWHTPLGPVIHRTDTKAFVLRSACYENHRAYEEWLKLTQTKSFAEFKSVLELNLIPMFNIAYADRVGNIFFLWNGTVPALPHAAHKAEAVPAARTADVWTRFHATADLPQLFNPPGGYVQNCNSPPYLTTLFAPLDPAKYPPYFGANDLSLRTQLSLRMVHNDRKLSLEEVCELKHDPTMLVAERVKADLIAALRATQPSSDIVEAIGVLERWDNTTAVDSRGGTLFNNWWDRYYDSGAGKHAVPWSAAEPTATPRGLADPGRAVQLFATAVEEVRRVHGRLDVPWGEAHRIRKGTVDLPVFGGPGTSGCFRVLDFRRDADGKLAANTGDSFVFAVEFSQPPKAYSVLAYSQSDVPGSPHFADQAPLFASGKMKRVAFTEEEIKAHMKKSYRPGEE